MCNYNICTLFFHWKTSIGSSEIILKNSPIKRDVEYTYIMYNVHGLYTGIKIYMNIPVCCLKIILKNSAIKFKDRGRLITKFIKIPFASFSHCFHYTLKY